MIRAGRAFATGAGFAALTSCGAIWGIQLLPAGPGDAGPDANFPSDTSMDARATEGGTSGSDSSVLPEGDAFIDAGADVSTDALGATDGEPPCTCLSGAPSGWTGPVAFATASSGTVPPLSCPALLPSVVYRGMQDPGGEAAQCSCACGAPQGGTCGARMTYYTNPCGMTLGGCISQSFGLQAGACTQLATVDGNCAGQVVKSFSPDYAQLTPGSCTPMPDVDVPPVTWATSAIACGPTGAWGMGTCAAGEVCTAATQTQSANLCLMAGGTQSCEGLPAPYAVQHVAYGGAVDSRGCSACMCGQPSPECDLGGTADFYSDSACTQSVGSRALSSAAGTCYSLPGSSYYAHYSPAANLSGSCTPSGGTPGGGVTVDGTMATTFCCAQ